MPVSPGQGGNSSSPTIAVLHAVDRPPALAEHACGAELRFATDDTLADTLPGCDALFVWDFTSDAVRGAWPAADTMRWVHTASAGVDRLIFPGLVDSDVTLTNSRGVFDTPMAEYVLGVVLAFAKDLPQTLRLQDRREWRHRETEGIAGRCAVVVGSGPIGRAIARLLTAAGLQVRLVGRRPADGVHGIDELDALLPEADFLVLAAPLTDRTRGLLDAAALGLLKPTARVVNVGRGALVVQSDLVDALAAGRIAGAALDVFETEPLPADSPLWGMPNVIVSPHMSGDTVGWRDALVELFADNLARYRAGTPLRNVVDKARGYVTGNTGGSA
ncbi:D-2-hydroxyacid dehydrogenase [Pseudonocardia bannensis]|uniref:D-2-hydroxyacid dehydrogenase n=1 Tax=Pseudonocardia bannensis TaxID=630973 RepID=A0A848DKZ8_9PSEU|nr:D-2-hydroxyacid dehydrogenase [Pseudonocardia bannensis]